MNNQTETTAATRATVHDDTEMIRRRQRERAGAEARMAAGAGFVANPTSVPALEPVWALALSGGGIRSATLSLGVIQAIAATPVSSSPASMSTAAPAPAPAPLPADRGGGVPPPPPQGAAKPRPPRPAGFQKSLLSRFGYLSTVSGGGYIGAFLVSLFLPGRLRPGSTDAVAAADDAVRVLCSEPPGRMHSDPAFTLETVTGAPLAWLRDNGRYLAPSGGGDMFYAVSLALRNWVAVHYVLGTVLMAVFAFTAAGSAWIPWLTLNDQSQLRQALLELSTRHAGWTDGWWLSPLFWPAGLLLIAWPLPAGLAFWIPQPTGDEGRNRVLNPAFGGLLVVIVALACAFAIGPRLLAHDVGSASPMPDFTSNPLWLGWIVTLFGSLHYLVASLRTSDIDLLRVRLGLTVIAGCFPSFINLSSLQSFYSARLTRAYLGASNGMRFCSRDRSSSQAAQRTSVAQPDLNDAVRMTDFLSADPAGATTLSTLAPLHLINVTINATVDPAEQLVQRDRKGLPLVVTPRGFTVDGGELKHFVTETPHLELQRTLSLGQWVGTSGAAFSTGIGRETSLGLSMLMGAANVRLGTWWQSGVGNSQGAGWLARATEFAFRTQSYLFGEFTAQFHGMNRRWQYLSDGGHFENTAAYDLLRPSRDVKFIVACDHGADPDYRFDDLANLIRLARIDLEIELQVESDVALDPVLRPWFGVPADFRSPAGAARDVAEGRPATMPAPRDDAVPAHEPVALLLRACQGWPARTTCWMVLIKPRVRTDSAADVVQYALANPAFPQQPTADQFFDEAQWESYRKLGHDNASHLLDGEVWGALQAYMARGGPPMDDVQIQTPVAQRPTSPRRVRRPSES